MTLNRVAFISDLHLDHNIGLLPQLEKVLKKRKPEVFIIAGDLFSGFTRTSAVLKRLKQIVPRVLFLPGNHDLWIAETTGNLSSHELYQKTLNKITRISGSEYLGLKPVYLKNKTAVVGVTGWYDNYPLPPVSSPDQHLCKWPGFETPYQVRNWQNELLHQQLEEAQKIASKIIVVTHMIPFMNLMKEYIPEQLFPYMGSQILGDTILKYPKVVYAISGHLHGRFLFSVPPGALPWEISPFGYPGELGKNPRETLEQSLRLIEV
ncbi:MAG: metallophosphoesterase [Deltaproteobacteria bacterium]|jgi:Icc-related predicted phosphoesterase|nr:metallophosphoesterase [Deltaproteobacteria bacterium]